jgi:AcrR family transcriptional regulator
MPAEDRRRAILGAVIPLLIEKGASVTTAEMARAAGIAEGTIFRVFADKAALMREAVKATMDPSPVKEAIRAISPSESLQASLAVAAQVLLDHFSRVIALAELLRAMPAPAGARKSEGRRLIAESSAEISAAVTELFQRHADELRVVPAKACAALRGLIFGSGHPLVPPNERLTVDEVVAILLSGIQQRKGP